MRTRKQKALRALAWAAAALVLSQCVFHIGILTPRQSICAEEQRAGCGHTRTVKVWRDGAIRWGQLFYLTENEQATMLSATYYAVPFGWMDDFHLVLDCSVPRPLHIGSRLQGVRWYCFGRVDDPAIARIELLACYRPTEESRVPEMGEAYVPVATVEAGDFLKKDGRSYFVTALPSKAEEENAYPIGAVARCYDAAGALLYEADAWENRHGVSMPS